MFDRRFGDIFRKAGIQVAELLRRSRLPEDFFSRRDILLTRAEYFHLVETLGTLTLHAPDLALRIAIEGQIETFSPPIFAAYCSSHGEMFFERLAHYKRLVGPIKIDVGNAGDTLRIAVNSDDDSEPLPPFFAELELLFLLGILRKATQSHISPVRIEMRVPPVHEQVLDYFGCPVVQTQEIALVITAADARKPFISRNDEMWQYIEPELRRRLSDMDFDDTMAARVRSALVELLPAGKTDIADVASKLCMSKRTLQRKLAGEQTTFQQQLNDTRLLLAKYYLSHSDRSSHDIAFLLGYESTTSFLRAFNAWTGSTLSEFRRK